jgi:hypothetical protein
MGDDTNFGEAPLKVEGTTVIFDEVPADVEPITITTQPGHVYWSTDTNGGFTVGEYQDVISENPEVKELKERVEKLEKLLEEKESRESIYF